MIIILQYNRQRWVPTEDASLTGLFPYEEPMTASGFSPRTKLYLPGWGGSKGVWCVEDKNQPCSLALGSPWLG
jgi:hypothetical protein